MGNGNAAGGQLVLQSVECQLRILIDPFDNECLMRFQNPTAVATHLIGRNAAGRTVALRPVRTENPIRVDDVTESLKLDG
jgi:hypothetical protein